jgi:hypothetical protein
MRVPRGPQCHFRLRGDFNAPFDTHPMRHPEYGHRMAPPHERKRSLAVDMHLDRIGKTCYASEQVVVSAE